MRRCRPCRASHWRRPIHAAGPHHRRLCRRRRDAPKATPAAIVDKLNQETNAALADPRIKARLAELGGNVLAGSPADFGKLIAEETEKWGKVIKFAGIKAD